MNTVKTPKGTELPLISLKGKDYLQVAHRLVWFNEVSPRFNVTTDFVLINDEQTIARAKVEVFNEEGVLVRSSTATKRETKKDFSDHTEKAETGAIGRALALMGYGTQFAIADLDEGSRLADSPVVNTKTSAKSSLKFDTNATSATITVVNSKPIEAETVAAQPKISTFRKSKPKDTSYAEQLNPGGNTPVADGWE